MLDKVEAADWLHELLKIRQAERDHLDVIHAYWHGRQPLPVVPTGVPLEVRRMAEMSRVNVLGLVVDVLAQSLYVSGYRAERAADDAPAWATWQANQLDARQTGVHRSALAFGTSYVLVLPGDPQVVIRGASPRHLTAVYGDDETWPEFALEVRRSRKVCAYRLFDREGLYEFVGGTDTYGPDSEPELIDVAEHGMGVCPVIRFVNTMDLDGRSHGEIETLIPLQNQIDFTTFDLMVAQHYGAFKQRYVLGWLAEDESQKLKASASRLWTFEDPEVRVGEFGNTDLSGYLDSRESTLQHLATISQTPPHHLLGKIANLSSDALAAAEAGQRRKLAERETLFGESWEQVLALAGQAEGIAPDPSAQVRWRDTEARSLSQMADALGKMSQMLSIPPMELWERIPGVSQQDVERWKAAAREADPVAKLTATLERQAAGGDNAGG